MKKILATLLAIVMILGVMPVAGLVSSADDPIALGAIIASAGYTMTYDSTAGCSKVPVDFYFGDGETVHEEMVEILANDPEIVPGTMAANLDAYTFSVSLTANGTTQTHAPSAVEVKDNWGDLDQGIYFYLGGFTTKNINYTVRVDITTPGGNSYYYEEDNVSSSGCPVVLEDVSGTIEGTNVVWTIDSATATLTFSGSGAVPDYTDKTARPWHEYAGEIVNVVAEGNVTRLGRAACNTFAKLDNIYLADCVEQLGFDCFAHSGTIELVRFSPLLLKIEQGAFYDTTVVDVLYEDEDGETYTSQLYLECTNIGGYNTALINAHWINDPVDWPTSGDVSDTIQWAFDEDTGTLTISGTGDMPERLSTKPWQPFTGSITTVVIEEGVTSISRELVANTSALERVEMSDDVTTIWNDAFAYCGTIAYFRLSANVTAIKQGIVYSSSITKVSCKKDWQAIKNQAEIGLYNTAFENAEWIDVEVIGVVHHLSIDKFGNGMENWGTPLRTQMLICPKWDGTWTNDWGNEMMNAEWTFVISDGTTDFTTHLYPDTIYPGGDWGILRFVFGQAQDPNERFVPVWGVEYTVTATVTYDGVVDTVTSGSKFSFKDYVKGGEGDTVDNDGYLLDADGNRVPADPITYNYYTITWTVDGVEEYTEEVIEGFKPVYHGAAASYQDGDYAHVANIPETAAATADATYNVTYTVINVKEGALKLWGNGYENWGGSATGSTQTELLLRPKDWQGNDLAEDIYNNSNDYTWIVTINGVAYNVKPTSHYLNWIVRFEPCLWATRFVPQAGQSYTVDLEIYDENDTLVWKSTTPATIEIAADFVPVVPTPSGDIDGDGELTVSDVSTLLDLIAAGTTDLAYDLDNDGEIAVSDVSALLDMIASAPATA